MSAAVFPKSKKKKQKKKKSAKYLNGVVVIQSIDYKLPVQGKESGPKSTTTQENRLQSTNVYY